MMNCPATQCAPDDSSTDDDSLVDEILDEIALLNDDIETDEYNAQLRSDFDQLPTFIDMRDNTSLFNLGLLTY